MLVTYFRLFILTVNNNDAVPFVVMKFDNSLQFNIPIKAGVFAAAGILAFNIQHVSVPETMCC